MINNMIKNRLLNTIIFIVIAGVIILILGLAYYFGKNGPYGTFTMARELKESVGSLNAMEKCVEASNKVIIAYKSLNNTVRDIQHSQERQKLESMVLNITSSSTKNENQKVESEGETIDFHSLTSTSGLDSDSGSSLETLLKKELKTCIDKTKSTEEGEGGNS